MLEYRHEDYQRLFQASGDAVGFYVSDIFRNYYRKFGVLITFSDGVWTCYMPYEVKKKLLQEGVRFYSSVKEFEHYRKEFNNFINQSNEFFEKLFHKEQILKREVENAFELTTKHFELYSKTEFFYTDGVFEELNKSRDEILKANAKKLDEIKTKGREHLNRIFFGRDGFASQLARRIGKQFDISDEDILAYSSEEILGLFDGFRVDKDTIKLRRSSFVTIDGKHSQEYIGDDARVFIETFEKVGDDVREIKGQIAHPGKARGQVKVISSDYYYDFSKLETVFESLPEAYILVAETTSPELMPACKKAIAILTNQGGMLSHAAIVSRELDIPCIVGIGNATEVLKDGMEVEVDAEKGIVRVIND